MAAQGPRFDLAEVDVAQGEDAERLEKNARQVLQRKADGCFVCVPADLPRLVDQQEASVVLLVVFNARQQHAPSILLRGLCGSDSRRIVQLLGDDVANATG